MTFKAHPRQVKPDPRTIHTWPDPFNPDLIYVRDPRDDDVIVKSRDYWATIAVQAIQDPASSSEWTVAMARAVLGEDGWDEAERICAIVDAAAISSGLMPSSGPVQ